MAVIVTHAKVRETLELSQVQMPPFAIDFKAHKNDMYAVAIYSRVEGSYGYYHFLAIDIPGCKLKKATVLIPWRFGWGDDGNLVVSIYRQNYPLATTFEFQGSQKDWISKTFFEFDLSNPTSRYPLLEFLDRQFLNRVHSNLITIQTDPARARASMEKKVRKWHSRQAEGKSVTPLPSPSLYSPTGIAPLPVGVVQQAPLLPTGVMQQAPLSPRRVTATPPAVATSGTQTFFSPGSQVLSSRQVQPAQIQPQLSQFAATPVTTQQMFTPVSQPIQQGVFPGTPPGAYAPSAQIVPTYTPSGATWTVRRT